MSAGASVLPGRFLQYRAVFRSDRPQRTPELRAVRIAYRTLNLAPEVTKITLPELGAADGAPAKLTLKWEANDPNDDDVSYRVALRRDAWPEWVEITREPTTEKTFTWDSTTVPSGRYRVRVTASDARSNRPEEALERGLESDAFVIDHDAPRLRLERRGEAVVIGIEDGATRLMSAAYAIDGGPWVAIFPDDRLFDAMSETITLALPSEMRKGSHLVLVRAKDAAGNAGSADLVIEITK
jgi:hypothetical protein